MDIHIHNMHVYMFEKRPSAIFNLSGAIYVIIINSQLKCIEAYSDTLYMRLLYLPFRVIIERLVVVGGTYTCGGTHIDFTYCTLLGKNMILASGNFT